MTNQKLAADVQDFRAWRNHLYQALGSRRCSVMELLDSLSSNLQASSVAALPEPSEAFNIPWAIPLSGQRVPADKKDIDVAQTQLTTIYHHESAPWKDKLSVLVADSLYSQRAFLNQQVNEDNLVAIIRVKSNRVFYRRLSISLKE